MWTLLFAGSKRANATLSRVRWPIRRVLVEGPSMVPTLRAGDTVVVWLRPVRPRPGIVVLAELPDAGLVVKRVTAVRTDGSVWLEGDNPFGSTDSRQIGGVDPAVLRGRVLVRLWPPARLRPSPGAGSD
jgi:nickel-type superoxide dismutase maturation protease